MTRGSLVAALLASASALAQEPMPAAPAPTDAPPSIAQTLLGRRVTLGAAGYGSGYSFRDGRWGDAFATQHLEARWRWGGFTGEGGLLHTLPVSTGGAAQTFTAHLRLGWTWSRSTLTVGALGQIAPGVAVTTQLLPTLTAAHAFDGFGLSAGLFDVQGLPLARVSFEHERFGVGYVFPLGVEARGRVRVSRAVSLQLQALAFRVFNQQLALVGVSGTYDADAGARGLTR